MFVTSENVLWGELNLASVKRIPFGFHKKLQRSVLAPNDVLVNLVGASIGRSAIVPQGIGDANVNQAVAVVSVSEDQLDPIYLCYLILSSDTQHKFIKGKVESARANISLIDLRNLQVPIPPLARQREFAARVADMRALQAAQARSRQRLEDLFQSLLHRAFAGEL